MNTEQDQQSAREQYADWKAPVTGSPDTKEGLGQSEDTADTSSEVLENQKALKKEIEDRFSSETQIRLGEAKSIGQKIAESFHGDRQEMVDLTLKSPDLVNRFVYDHLTSEETYNLVEDLSSYQGRLVDYVRSMSERYHKKPSAGRNTA